MGKKQNFVPEVSEEFRQQYQSEYACFPISWGKRVAALSDEVAGRLLKAVLEHCETGRTEPPEGMDSFAFGLVLDKVDEYGQKGLEFAWARAYKAQNAAQSRWGAGKDGEGRQEDAQGCSSIPKHSQECHNIISTSISTSTPTLKENTNTNQAREKSREGVGSGEGFDSSSLDALKNQLKEKAAALQGYSRGQKPGSLEELQKFCGDLGFPGFGSSSLWSEMEFAGWEVEEKGQSRAIKSWQNFVIHRIAVKYIEEGAQAAGVEADEYAHYQ